MKRDRQRKNAARTMKNVVIVIVVVAVAVEEILVVEEMVVDVIFPWGCRLQTRYQGGDVFIDCQQQHPRGLPKRCAMEMSFWAIFIPMSLASSITFASFPYLFTKQFLSTLAVFADN